MAFDRGDFVIERIQTGGHGDNELERAARDGVQPFLMTIAGQRIEYSVVVAKAGTVTLRLKVRAPYFYPTMGG